MKKFAVLLLLFIGLSYAQSIPDPVLNKSYAFNIASTGASEDVSNKGIQWYKLVFQNKGATAPSACDVQLQLSSDNFNRNILNYGSFPCNIDGATRAFQFSAAYVRLNVDLYVPSSNNVTNINLLGFVNKPLEVR